MVVFYRKHRPGQYYSKCAHFKDQLSTEISASESIVDFNLYCTLVQKTGKGRKGVHFFLDPSQPKTHFDAFTTSLQLCNTLTSGDY
jgi:hypothetical protein